MLPEETSSLLSSCVSQERDEQVRPGWQQGEGGTKERISTVVTVRFANEVHFSDVLTATEHTGCVGSSAAGVKSAFAPHAFSLLHALGSCEQTGQA